MANFTPVPQRFVFTGLHLNAPADLLPVGKFPYVENIRSYEEGILQPREGLSAPLNNAGLGGSVHSLVRLNDSTPNASVAATRFAGVGANLYQETVGSGVWNLVDTGYSGNPLSALSAMPPQADQPWLYFADSSRLRKINVNGTVYPTGVMPPLAAATEPTAVLNQIGSTIPDNFDNAATWTAVSGAAAATWGALAATNRVNTTIGTIVYDSGATGYATVAPTALTNINDNMVLHVGGAEYAIVTGITIAIASTTIGAITYDAGATGLCTIQPASSLGTGQLEGPVGDIYRLRSGTDGAVSRALAGQGGLPPDPVAVGQTAQRSTRQADFPVHSLVRLNGAETVQILSVALGQDGVLSFRCKTAGTFAAGQTITGLAGFRAFLAGTYAAGAALVSSAIAGTVTVVLPTGATTVPATVGIRAALTPNLAQVSTAAETRAVLPDDIVHLSVKITTISEVQNIRVYFDVSNGGSPFLQDYFFFEWRANDIIAAIQSTNAATTANVVTAQQTAVQNDLVSQPVISPGATAAGAVSRVGPPAQGSAAEPARPAPTTPSAQASARRVPTASVGPNAAPGSGWLTIGNNEWIELRCRVGDLVRIGSDSTRTLANVSNVEILVGTVMDALGMGLSFGDLYVAGGFGLDVGDIGAPYVYRYRYRSTALGIVSNPSPALRGGVSPRRQSVGLTATVSSDTQVDKVDWFRFGGSLTQWTYVASQKNDGAVFLDTFGDSAITGGEVLAFDNFPPWPTTDLPRTGVVSVAGTAVTYVSGDHFNISWAQNSAIVINGVVCSLYASPTSTTRLYVNENIGALTNVPFYVTSATLLAQPLPALWGDFANGLYFGCGDPNNPGVLYWSKTNTPDIASDANTLLVTSASEPLLNGYLDDGTPYVFSSDNLYAIERDSSVPGGLRHQITPCGRGLWTRWAFAVAPEGGYFLAKDGIYLSTRGGPAQSITAEDLRPLFPHDGGPGVAVNGISPPDLTASAEKLRLTYTAGMLYFDYVISGGASHTLVYDTLAKRWYYDTYSVAIRSRYWEPGQAVSDQVVGDSAGNVYQTTGANDNTTAIAGTFKTGWVDGGLPRLEKLVGDYIVDCDPQNLAAGVSVTFGYNDFGTTIAPVTIGTALTGRQQFVQDLTSGAGVLARNCGLSVTWSSASAVPMFFLWQPSWVPKAETTFKRATDWDNLGVQSSKYVRAVWLRADTGNVARTVQIQYDGGTVGATLTVTDNGEVMVPYAMTAPFVANLVRIVPTDAASWRLYEWRFEFDEYPGLIPEVTAWNNAGVDGAKYVRGVVIRADTGNLPVSVQIQGDEGAVGATITIQHDGQSEKGYAILVPFVAHLLRMVPAANARLFGAAYIFDPYPEFTAQISTWTDAGFTGAKYVRGVVIDADTGNLPVTCAIAIDGDAAGPTLTLLHNGQQEVGYAFTPFVTHLLRLKPSGNARLFDDTRIRWIFDPYPEQTAQVTAWDDAGNPGAKYVQGIVLRSDSGNLPVSVQVQGDGGVVEATIVVTSNGQTEQAFSWEPFVAHMLRLVPSGPIRLFDGSRWVWEPTPELALLWQTQQTTHDQVGYFVVRDMVVAYSATTPVFFTLTVDGSANATLLLPSTGGQYARTYVRVPALKGRSVQYRWQSKWNVAPFQLFQRDCNVRIQPWGSADESVIVSPFGGPSRAIGAQI